MLKTRIKHSYLIALFILGSTAMNAQSPNWQWATGPTGQGVSSAVCTDANKNVFITGHFLGALICGINTLNDSLGPNQDVFIAKYDAHGNVKWARSGKGYADANAICADADGNVYVAGNFYNDSITFGSQVLTNPNQGPQNSNIFFVKYDSVGTVVWAKNLGIINNDYALGITADAHGYIYLTGNYTGDSLTLDNITLQHLGTGDAFIAKFDTAGIAHWVKNIGSPYVAGSASVSTDPFGNVFMSGYFLGSTLYLGNTNTSLTSSYAYNVFVTKYDSSGNMRWTNYAGGNIGNGPGGIAADGAGSIFTTGYFSDTIAFGVDTIAGNGYQNIFLAKYDSAGNLLWAKATRGTYVDQANGIAVDKHGNALITGYFQSDTISFDNIELFNPIGSQATFVAQYNTNRQALWAIAPTGTSNNTGAAIAYNDEGIFITGTFQSSDIIFGNDTLLPSPSAIFLAKLDTSILTNLTPVSPVADGIIVYPNPSTGSFYFKGVDGKNRIEVYNIQGETVSSSIVESDNYSLSLTGYSKGLYLYRITNEGSVIQQGKIVLE